MPCYIYAGVGQEMAADYDQRSCLPSGASREGEAHLRRERLVYGGGGSSYKLLFNIVNIIHFFFSEDHSSLTIRPARSLETITALVASY